MVLTSFLSFGAHCNWKRKKKKMWELFVVVEILTLLVRHYLKALSMCLLLVPTESYHKKSTWGN